MSDNRKLPQSKCQVSSKPCCPCNGHNAKCKRCKCVISGQRCTSCQPFKNSLCCNAVVPPSMSLHVINNATLLGSPIGDIGSITVAIDAKTAMLKCLRERLHCLTCHDAYLLLYCVTLWPYLNFCTCLERHLAFSHPV